VPLERDVIEQARNGALTPKAGPKPAVRRVRCLPRREASHGEPRAHRRVRRRAVGIVKDRIGDVLLSTITREMIEGFQAKRKLDGVSNRTVNMDVGTLRKVLKRYGHWRRLQDHVTMLSEAEGVPIGRALTNEEQKRLLETAASNPEWEHVYCAAVLAANTSMRGVEVKHVRRKDVDLEKVWDVESATGKRIMRFPSSAVPPSARASDLLP
jgi:integrase